MIQLTEYIFNDIIHTMDPAADKQIFRVDGFEIPRLYAMLCEKMQSYCHEKGLEMIARLARRKFEQFEENGTDPDACAEIRHMDWVDFEDHMTFYRNMVPNPGEKLVILLLGTDLVEDKGGLNDFYAITPGKIDSDIGNRYSDLMSAELRKVMSEEKIQDVVNRFYTDLFKCVPKNLLKVSETMDRWLKESPTVKEAMVGLLETLPEWGLPKIEDLARTLTPDKFISGKNSLVQNAGNFINGKAYSKVTKGTIKGIQKRFEQYRTGDDKGKIGKYALEYPDGQRIPSLEELESTVQDFVMGKRTGDIREALIHTDYSIISDVLNFKVPDPKPSKEKLIRGMPLTVFLECLLTTLMDKEPVDTIIVKLDKVRLSGIPSGSSSGSDDEREKSILDAWKQIAVFTGGIEKFLAVENWHREDGESIKIEIEPADGFAPSGAAQLLNDGILTTCTGSNHKIDFRVIVQAGNETVNETLYCWNIDPAEDWMMAFSDLRDMPDDEVSYIPVETAREINDAFAIKDEDGFTYWLNHTKRLFLTGENAIIEQLKQELTQPEAEKIYVKLYKLGSLFQKFRKDVSENGFYASITGPSNTADAFLDGYIDYCGRIIKESVCVGKLSALTGRFTYYFTILPDSAPVKGSPCARQVIVPPWHPATLEKLADRMVFIRSGMYEALQVPDQSNKNITDRIGELLSLSTIHNSTDAFFGMDGRYLTHGVPFGYYTLYGNVEYSEEFTSAKQIERKEAVFDDDFDEKDMKQITREALVLLHVIRQYVETYPQAERMLSLTFINPDDLQIIVAALCRFVEEERKKGLGNRLSINVTVLTNADTYGTRTYLAYWINHMFTQDDALEIKAYLQVYTDDEKIARLVPPTTDIAFYFDALNTERGADYHFYPMHKNERMTDCRFPMVFKPMLKDTYSLEHAIDITQPQFRAATAHTQVLKAYNDKLIDGVPTAFVQRTLLDSNRGRTIADVQNQTVWLCCIDSAMDKYSVRNLYADKHGIIGFTTGEGSYGQMNLAITCRDSMIDDMRKRCKRRLKKIFPGWDDSLLTKAAKQCLKKAGELDGVSILKAMNPNDYDMNNYLAYLIASELVEKREDRLSVLIRLDSYRHWFSDASRDRGLVPDFLLIEGDITEQPLHIKATVIEAKISACLNMETEHLPKAEQQVAQGLEILSSHFNPGSRSVERRYWLAQLYRAIAFLQADTDRSSSFFNNLAEQLNMMIEGQFDIEWHGRILACEIDSLFGIEKGERWIEGYQIEHWRIGQQAIQNILQGMPIDTPVEFDLRAAIEEDEQELEEEPLEMSVSSYISDPSVVPETEKETVKRAPVLEVSRSDVETGGEHVAETGIQQMEKEADAESSSRDKEVQPYADARSVQGDSEKAVELPKSLEPGNAEDLRMDALPIQNIRVLIGQDHRKQNVYWEFGNKQLSNRHLLITGASGQGKTYAIQTFLYELAKQNISSVVFDYTDGFLPTKLEQPFEDGLSGRIQQHYAITGSLPINPFKRQPLSIPGLPEGTLMENPATVAGRIAAIIKHVYGLGEQQFSAFYQACKEGIEQFDNQMDFNKLRVLLENSTNKHAASVLSKMQQFFDFDLFDTQNAFDWSRITDRDGKVTIIQLTNLDRNIQTVITEMLLWDAWYSLTKFGSPQKPFVVVLDEAQNLSIADGSPAQKILQEGRKYGWSAWFATQFMKGALQSDEISRLQQAAETLNFKPSAEEMSSVAARLSDSSSGSAEWIDVLKKMQKGQCIVKGDRILQNGTFGSGPATLVRVSSFEDREKH